MRARWKWLPLLGALLALTWDARAVTLNKCCPHGLSLHQQDATCVPDPEDNPPDAWMPVMYALGENGRGFSILHKVPEDWNISAGTKPVCNGGPPTFIYSGETPGFVLLNNGSLLLNQHTDTNVPLSPNEFCVDTNSALACMAPKKRGVRKCCGSHAAFSEKSGSCVLAQEYGAGLEGTTAAGFPTCQGGPGDLLYAVSGELEGNLTAALDEGGSLQLAPPPAPPLKLEQYCLERVIERPQRVSVFVCVPPLRKPTPVRPQQDRGDDLRFTVYPAGLAISAFFLAATLATGCLLPKAHHALHWRCQTCHVACLLVGDVFLATVQLAGSQLPPEACVSMAVLMHFFFLSAFFWLNAMCFNIWWTFRDLRPTSAEPGQEKRRYRAYSVYAWGGPLLIAGLALMLDLMPTDEFDPSLGLLRPRFGEKRCWFYGDLEIFTFFFGPVGLLLVLNLALFAATTRELTCGLWRREGVKSAGGGAHGAERSTLSRVCLKLVVVMGVTWIADVMSWALGPSYLWIITDLINTLQGVFIFIVVGCQPQVWAAVKRLWWCGRGDSPAMGSAANQPMSSSSQGPPSTTAAEQSSPATRTTMDPVDPPLETPC